MNKKFPTADPPLTPEEEALAAKLSVLQIEKIDEALLSNVTDRWRKIAMIVGLTMGSIQDRVYGLPDLYYAQRVRKLVSEGILESQGDINCMGLGEVRQRMEPDKLRK